MTATSTPPGIPSASRLAGWIGESQTVGGGLRAGGPRRPDAGRPRAPGTRRGRLIRTALPRGRWRIRRPAHAGPEPGAPLSPGPPLGFRLPSCRGPAPRLRRTSTQDDAPPRRLVDARLGNERVKLSASPAAAATSAAIAAAT